MRERDRQTDIQRQRHSISTKFMSLRISKTHMGLQFLPWLIPRNVKRCSVVISTIFPDENTDVQMEIMLLVK